MRGGTNQSGKEISRANKASTVEPSDQAMLVASEPPRLRSRCAKRRSATSADKEGPMNTATSSSDNSTINGVKAKITISGATTVLRLPAPTPCNHDHTLFMRSE